MAKILVNFKEITIAMSWKDCLYILHIRRNKLLLHMYLGCTYVIHFDTLLWETTNYRIFLINYCLCIHFSFSVICFNKHL